MAALILDALVAERGPQLACADLTLGDSLLALAFTGKLQLSEYYEHYEDAFYTEGACEGEPVLYWLSFSWHGMVPRLEQAEALVEMSYEAERAQALLRASGFEVPLHRLVSTLAIAQAHGRPVVVSHGTTLASPSGEHEVRRDVVQDEQGRVMSDYLRVRTRMPGGA